MKLTLLCIFLLGSSIAFSQSTNQQSTQKIDKSWEAEAYDYIARADYFFKQFSSEYVTANPKQNLQFGISGLAIETSPIQAKTFRHSRMALTALKSHSIPSDLSPLQVVTHENFLQFDYSGWSVQYINGKEGLRQNFLLYQKPSGHEALNLTLTIEADLIPEIKNDHTLNLIHPQTGKIVLHYDGLKVWDKNGVLLPAKMILKAQNQLQIWVDDSHAIYPVTVDPLTHVPEWETSADGILPGLLTDFQLQIDALHGYAVAGVGDVNNDGYDDVAVGAPAAIDILAGPVTVVGAGAVFLFYGSENGLSLSPNRILRASTPVTNALFGYSIASGNITGSPTPGAIHSDIVVGAPLDSYTASVGGFPSTATVTAGKVYVFDGDELTAGPANPLLSVYLNGSGLLAQGLNVNVKALFGLSVGTTEDMNGDGLGELLVGAPAYKGVDILSVNSGAAYVYYSSNLLSNAPTVLQPPSLVGFPDLINLSGLLYGWSVDGAGDYNQDGMPDVVVGAPGGVNLAGLGLLGGTAYVYAGTGAGVNPNILTRLSPNGTVVGSVANLFGFAVKGVKNAGGIRTGNILVGAPLGNVLSDVLGGLRLKTGTVYLFGATAAPAQNEVATQSIASPRGPNLLQQLLSVNIDVSALFGASLDNMRDVNCDGIGDIIVGEPLSTGVGLIAADAIGGGASIFLGNADGSYQPVPYWSLENSVSFNAGVNAGSLLGFSVAGAGKIQGPLGAVRALVGAPGKALDFGAGLLNLGNTVGTLFSFAAVDNGLGKAYSFAMGCKMEVHPDIDITLINVPLNGNVQTNDQVLAGTTYGTPVPDAGNPGAATLVMNPDGSYSFTANTPGVYNYIVPVCTPEACTESHLQITVMDEMLSSNPPIVNTDIAVTSETNPVVIPSLHNDAGGSVNTALNPASVSIVTAPAHGSTSIDPLTGDITYTADPGFAGKDTLWYQVCDDATPALCAMAQQIITVLPPGSSNTVLAADDFVYFPMNTVGTGNVLVNDSDPESDGLFVTAQNLLIAGKGTLQLNTDGSFSFTPDPGFSGPVEVAYELCDDGDPQACTSATLYLLVSANSIVPVDLIRFDIQKQKCDALLVWETAQEINFHKFEVELSVDGGSHFIPVGSIPANGSRGDYQFRYVLQSAQTHLFRLKMLDADNSVAYSTVQSVTGCNNVEAASFVYPSPVVDILHVEIRNAGLFNSEAWIYNSSGKLMMRPRITGHSNRLSVRNLLPGLYFIKLQDGSSLKFIKD